MLLVFSALLIGCGDPPDRHLGKWQIDKDDLARGIDENYPSTDSEIVDLKSQLLQANKNDTWTFTADGTYTHRGLFPSNGRFEIYDYGKDWVVLRIYFHSEQDGNQPSDDQSYNEMSVGELIEKEGIDDGNAPGLLGLDFVSEDTFRMFFLAVENGRLTNKRVEEVLYRRTN